MPKTNRNKIKKMKIVINARKLTPRILKTARRLKRLVPRSKLYATEPLASKVGIKSSELGGDIILAVGGDGTLLSTVRNLDEQVPVLPIEAGGVCFLSEVTYDALKEAISKILKGKYKVVRWTRLQPILNGKKLRRAMNEVAVVTGMPGRTCGIEVVIDERKYETFDADGVIISTSVGSTAYSLSAGGPIIDPDAKAFVIVPICPYTVKGRPLVIPESSRIRVRTTHGKAFVTVDGRDPIKMNSSDTLLIRKSRKPARIVRFGSVFYKNLAKLVR